jgi:hypothetical protein
LSIGWDRRWSAARITLQSILLSLAAIELAVVISWAGLKPASPLRLVFVPGLFLLLIGLGLPLRSHGDAAPAHARPLTLEEREQVAVELLDTLHLRYVPVSG